MLKKVLSIVVLVSFIIFSCSCHSKMMWERSRIKPRKHTGLRISGVITKSGKWVGFMGPVKARIKGKFIIGETEDGEGGYKIARIHLDDVKKIWMKKFDFGKTVFRVAGLSLLIPVLLISINVALGGESPLCPFVYSFDGSDFVMEGEPFAGAVSKGFKRTEWSVLKNIKEVNGNYILMVTNEVDDTDYIDDIKLIAVDHEPGEIIIPDNKGNIHALSSSLLPLSAYDRMGNDITGLVSEIDDKFWTTKEKNIDVFDNRTLRDELIFEFPKPEISNHAKLIFRGGNTLWGAGTISRYLKLYGENAGEIYQNIKRQGKELDKLKDLLEKNNIFFLDVKVLTENGWEKRAKISGAPPLVPDHRVYSLDLHDVQGDTVKIKISPPAAFWKIDYLALDFSENRKLEVRELTPLSSKDHLGNDLIKILEKEDGNYLKLEKKGSRAEIIFEASQYSENFERTIILKISGYYEIEVTATGEEKREKLIENIHLKPEVFLKHSISEFLSAHNKNKDN